MKKILFFSVILLFLITFSFLSIAQEKKKPPSMGNIVIKPIAKIPAEVANNYKIVGTIVAEKLSDSCIVIKIGGSKNSSVKTYRVGEIMHGFYKLEFVERGVGIFISFMDGKFYYLNLSESLPSTNWYQKYIKSKSKSKKKN